MKNTFKIFSKVIFRFFLAEKREGVLVVYKDLRALFLKYYLKITMFSVTVPWEGTLKKEKESQ